MCTFNALSKNNQTIVQEGLNKKSKIDFSYYERNTFYKNAPNVNFSYLTLEWKVAWKNLNVLLLVLRKIFFMKRLMMRVDSVILMYLYYYYFIVLFELRFILKTE